MKKILTGILILITLFFVICRYPLQFAYYFGVLGAMVISATLTFCGTSLIASELFLTYGKQK
jgi:hypothetical protein